MRILKLVLTYKWYDMIESGKKKEEYRAIKPSIVSLLFDWKKSGLTRELFTQKIIDDGHWGNVQQYYKGYNCIEFYRAYGKDRRRMILELNGLKVGIPILEWSDGWENNSEWNKNAFVLQLGNLIAVEQTERHSFDEWMEITRQKKS